MESDSKQSRGGKARAENLTPERRSEIAREAASRRWAAAEDHVHHALDVGVADFVGWKFRCAVLEGEIRVISGTEFMRVMGIYRSGALSTRRSQDDELHFPLYLAFKNLRPYVLQDARLVDAIRHPIRYREEGRPIAEGLPGTVLRRILSVWVRALDAGVLGASQQRIAEQAKKLLDALADVAIELHH